MSTDGCCPGVYEFGVGDGLLSRVAAARSGMIYVFLGWLIGLLRYRESAYPDSEHRLTQIPEGRDSLCRYAMSDVGQAFCSAKLYDRVDILLSLWWLLLWACELSVRLFLSCEPWLRLRGPISWFRSPFLR